MRKECSSFRTINVGCRVIIHVFILVSFERKLLMYSKLKCTRYSILTEKFLDSKFVLSGLMFDGVEVLGPGQTTHYCLSLCVQVTSLRVKPSRVLNN